LAIRSLLLTLLAFVAIGAAVRAQDAPPAPPPQGSDDTTPRADEVVVTALRHPADAFDVPASVSVVGEDELRSGPNARSLPNALTRLPGVLLQKTGPGQSSPYIRGFTGFRTLLMVDGIRLNNSVFRDGPNQYLGTVDNFAIETLELTRGPASVLWGSDAIGGAINALTGEANAEQGWYARWIGRWSSAERSLFNRVEVEGGVPGEYALKAGVTTKRFGNIRAGSGSGNLPGTAYDEFDADFRIDIPLDNGPDLTFAAQRVRQTDVPRTHKTVDAVPFHGTVAGTELSRELDQSRDLIYGRLRWDGRGEVYDDASFTLSYQRQSERQDRLRAGGKFDVRGFDVHTIGTQLQFETDTDLGLLTWGFEHYHDEVDSFRRDFTGGVLTGTSVQGPVADDASYDLFGMYVQDEVSHGPWETVFGMRFSHAAADADRVDNPAVAGSDPTTPGNIISIDKSWNSLVGSVRTLRRVNEHTNVYAGLSQGFRAPNLSDLSSDLTDSGIETPAPNLDPEHFVQFELGARTDKPRWSGDLAVYYTWIRDMIVKSPTGVLIGGVPVLSKSNVGDGFLYGIEGRWEYRCDNDWTVFTSGGWLDGEVDQFTAGGAKVSKPKDRTMPFTALAGATYQPEGGNWWLTADALVAGKADKLSLRDMTDLSRIPPGGTPGYGVGGVRIGKTINARTRVTVGIENLFNKDYRIHGSGQNEPGRALVVSWDVRL